MAYTLKDFMSDNFHTGFGIADMLSPPIISPITTPLFGSIFAFTIAPVLNGGLIAFDKAAHKYQLLKRREVSDAEKSITEIFGKMAIEGYRYYDGGVQMEFTEACVHNIYPNGRIDKETNGHDVHHNREQCAKDALGNLAASVMGKTRGFGAFKFGVEERFIVVRKEGEIKSSFYKATEIDDPTAAPKNSIPATHQYYEGVIGHGKPRDITHYAIKPVNKRTENRLVKLGL